MSSKDEFITMGDLERIMSAVVSDLVKANSRALMAMAMLLQVKGVITLAQFHDALVHVHRSFEHDETPADYPLGPDMMSKRIMEVTIETFASAVEGKEPPKWSPEIVAGTDVEGEQSAGSEQE